MVARAHLERCRVTTAPGLVRNTTSQAPQSLLRLPKPSVVERARYPQRDRQVELPDPEHVDPRRRARSPRRARPPPRSRPAGSRRSRPRRRAWPRRRRPRAGPGRAARTPGSRRARIAAACTTRSASIGSSTIGTITPRPRPGRAPARSGVAPTPARGRAAPRPGPPPAARSGRMPSTPQPVCSRSINTKRPRRPLRPRDAERVELEHHRAERRAPAGQGRTSVSPVIACQPRLSTTVLSSVRRSMESGRPRGRHRLRAGPAAERQVGLPVVRALVDVHPAGPHRLGEAQPSAQVAREDGGQQPVRRTVDRVDASSRERIVDTGATGPNVSSRAIAMSGVTPSITVASKKRSLPWLGARLPSGQHDGAADRRHRERDVVFAAVALVVHGASVVASSNGSPIRIRFSIAAAEPRGTPRARPRAPGSAHGRAALARVQEAAVSVAATAASRSASSITTAARCRPSRAGAPCPPRVPRP